MNHRDIRTQLLINTKDLDTFRELCQIDKLSQDICKTELFWKTKYANEDIPFCKYYNNFKLNILEYQYSLDCYERALRALNIISFNEDNDKSNEYSIFVSSPDDLEIFSKYEFYEQMVEYFLPILIVNHGHKHDFTFLSKNKLFVTIYPANDNKYILYFGNKYELDNNIMFDILYNIIHKQVPNVHVDSRWSGRISPPDTDFF